MFSANAPASKSGRNSRLLFRTRPPAPLRQHAAEGQRAFFQFRARDADGGGRPEVEDADHGLGTSRQLLLGAGAIGAEFAQARGVRSGQRLRCQLRQHMTHHGVVQGVAANIGNVAGRLNDDGAPRRGLRDNGAREVAGAQRDDGPVLLPR